MNSLLNTNYVLLSDGEPKHDLSIIYSAQSVIDLFNTGFPMAGGDRFVRMIDLPIELQEQYIEELTIEGE